MSELVILALSIRTFSKSSLVIVPLKYPSTEESIPSPMFRDFDSKSRFNSSSAELLTRFNVVIVATTRGNEKAK